MIFEPSSPRRTYWRYFSVRCLHRPDDGVPFFARNRPSSATLDPLHTWNAGSNPASLEIWVNQRLTAAQADVDRAHRRHRAAHGKKYAAPL